MTAALKFHVDPLRGVIGARALACLPLTLTLLACSSAAANVRVLPETAIPYTRFLSKADFDQRFPGDRLENPSDLVRGWYVTYQHLSLRYYFGPILLESIGQDYREQLESIVAAAVEKRPDLQDFKIDLRFEPVAPPPPGEAAPESEREPETSISPPPPPPPPPGLWARIKRIFGF